MIYYCVDCQRRVLRKEIHIFHRHNMNKEIIHRNKVGNEGRMCFGTVWSCANIMAVKTILFKVDNFPKMKWLMEQSIPINRCDNCKHRFVCYSGGQ